MTDKEIQVLVSTKVLKNIPDASVQNVLRGIVFSKKNKIDWKEAYKLMLKEMPEMKNVTESFDNIRVPDLSNQPMTPSGVGGGMPTRWVWSEYGRFLNAYGIRNGFNVTFNLSSAYDIKNKLAYLYDQRDKGLINSDDLQELEERLRTVSDFVIGGNDNQSGAAIEEIEYDDMANESFVSEGGRYDLGYVTKENNKYFAHIFDTKSKGSSMHNGKGCKEIVVGLDSNGMTYKKLRDELSKSYDISLPEEDSLSDYVFDKSGKRIWYKFDDMANESVSEGFERYNKDDKYAIKQIDTWTKNGLLKKESRDKLVKAIKGIAGDSNFKGGYITKHGNDVLTIILQFESDKNSYDAVKANKTLVSAVEKEANIMITPTNKDVVIDIFPIESQVSEEVKPSTSEKQLKHLEEIRPLAHSDEANAKRKKTLNEKRARKLINVIDEDDLKK